MDYMLLIVEPRGQRAERSEAEGQEAYATMLRYADALKARGVLKACSALQGDAQGRRVQRRQGRLSAVDGPFAETKELIGGYFLIDCASLDEATELAAMCPAAEFATVEVRPLGPCFL